MLILNAFPYRAPSNRLELLIGQPQHDAPFANFERQIECPPDLVVDQTVASPGGFSDAGRLLK